MIRQLRRVHRVVALGLVAVLPAALFAGLQARREVPRQAPAAEGEPAGASTPWVRSWSTAGERPVQVDVSEDGTVRLTPQTDLQRPDVLVYWSSGDTGLDGLERLKVAHLLGTLAGTAPRTYELPDAASASPEGELVLYSLAHREIVECIPLGGG